MSPKTTPNADRPRAERFAAFARRAMVSPATSDNGQFRQLSGYFMPGQQKTFGEFKPMSLTISESIVKRICRPIPAGQPPGGVHALLCARTCRRLPRGRQVEPVESVVVAVPLRAAWWRKARAVRPEARPEIDIWRAAVPSRATERASE
jgi:hypothetical protein